MDWTLKHTKLFAVILFLSATLPLMQRDAFSKGEKLSPEEIVQQHLASVATPELLKERKTLALKGTCRYRALVSPGGRADLSGPAQVVSSGRGMNLLFNFEAGNYGSESFVTDGKKAATGYATPGNRSALAELIQGQKFLLTEGLFGGTLSTAWPLFDIKGRKARLKVRGLKKIDDVELYEMDYRPRRGSGDVKVKLYFDPETFRHVMTTYDMRITARLGSSPADSARQRTTRFKIEERFGNFKEVDGYTLPTTWRIQFNQFATGGALLLEWQSDFKQSAVNMELNPQFFHVQ